MSLDFEQLSDAELIRSYAELLKELKARKIISSKNVIGDLGESIAINHYNSTPGLPKLLAALPGTVNFDATGKNGKRYSIKAASGRVTGIFFGLPSPTESLLNLPPFDFVIIVKFDGSYALESIVEITWEQFLQFRKWLPHHKAYNLPISNKLLSQAKPIFIRSYSDF